MRTKTERTRKGKEKRNIMNKRWNARLAHFVKVCPDGDNKSAPRKYKMDHFHSKRLLHFAPKLPGTSHLGHKQDNDGSARPIRCPPSSAKTHFPDQIMEKWLIGYWWADKINKGYFSWPFCQNRPVPNIDGLWLARAVWQSGEPTFFHQEKKGTWREISISMSLSMLLRQGHQQLSAE